MTKVCQVGWHEPFGLCDRTSLGDRVALAGHAIFMSYLCHIWVWVNTYRYIFSGMNIHLPAILGFTRGTRVLTHPHLCHMLGIFGDPSWNLKMPTTLWKNDLWALSSRDFLGWIWIDIVWYCIAFPWNLVPQGFPWGSPRSIFWPRTLVVFAFWTTPSIRTPVNSLGSIGMKSTPTSGSPAQTAQTAQSTSSDLRPISHVQSRPISSMSFHVVSCSMLSRAPWGSHHLRNRGWLILLVRGCGAKYVSRYIRYRSIKHVETKLGSGCLTFCTLGAFDNSVFARDRLPLSIHHNSSIHLGEIIGEATPKITCTTSTTSRCLAASRGKKNKENLNSLQDPWIICHLCNLNPFG